MLKDRWLASKHFISADLGASCLGWLAGFFAFAVALGVAEQHHFILLPDILRRYIFQIFLIVALISLFRKGWRTSVEMNRVVWVMGFGWIAGYLVALKILDLAFASTGYSVSFRAPDFLFDDQIVLTAVVAPIVEELFFRDVLFRTFLSRWPRFLPAMIATSFFFMIAHQSFYIGALLLGIINSVLYVYSGSVVPGILFHALSNLSWYFFPKLCPHFFEALKSGGWLNLFYRN